MKERLQKVMAHRGICSRRKAEELIVAGKVFVNGEKITTLGVQVDPDVEITVNAAGMRSQRTNQKIQKTVYILLNKPVGFICSTSSEQGQSVLDLITEQNYISGGEKAAVAWSQIAYSRIYPVGRLDKDSEGLVLLTNDGELANKLTHPRYEHEKEYEVTIVGRVPNGAERVLMSGMDIGDGEFVQGIDVRNIKTRGKRTIVTVVLKEGKNRQIRRMFGKLGMDVVQLKRTRINSYNLKTLSIGKWILVQAP
jgi:23S rRNA pseudouridine2605 synthase